MSARALVQNGCTSAVEAAIIGTPALAFRPSISENYEVDLSNRLSIDCRTVKDLISAIQAPGIGLSTDQTALLRHHIASLDGPLSCERILDSLDSHAHLLAVPEGNRLMQHLAGLAGHYRRRAIRAFTTRQHRSKSSATYTSHKFAGFSDDMVANRIERFRAVFSHLPAMKRHWLTRDILVIERA